MFCPLSSRSASVLHLFHQSHPQAITRQLIHGQDALWAAHNGTYLMEGANKQVISSQADSLIKISRSWADFFPANTSNQPV
nr:hypothetical protein [Escherichia coli]